MYINITLLCYIFKETYDRYRKQNKELSWNNVYECFVGLLYMDNSI